MLLDSRDLETATPTGNSSGASTRPGVWEVWRGARKRVASCWSSACPVRVTVGRSLPVDALRGLCFVIMTVNHFPRNLLGGFSNYVYGPFGFFSSVAGFIFLSGLVSGSAYETYRQKHGFGAMTLRVMHRIRDVYLAQMILYCSLLVAVVFHFHGSSAWVFGKHPLKAILLGVTLLHEPQLLDILPMYCFFLALVPLVLWLFSSGNVWQVLGGSAALWLVSGLVVQFRNDPGGITLGAFNPLSYQVLFVFGLAFGARKTRMNWVKPATERIITVGAIALAICFLLLRIEYAINPAVEAALERVRPWFSVHRLGPLRLLSFAAFGVALKWLLGKKDWLHCDNPLFRWLVFLGQHALPVFVWSVLSSYAALALLPPDASRSVAAIVMMLSVMSLGLPAFVHATGQSRKRRVRDGAGTETALKR
jgi:hypothetical protein